jgi:ribosomal protein S18 acetylase RimI-like enzyme
VTVHEYRKGDWAGVAELWRTNPSDEYPLLGLDADAVGAVMRKSEGIGIRFILGFARLIRRPIFVALIDDVGGRVIGTTLLSFSPESGYVSGVVVDTTVRRQGHAQAMLRVCDQLCQKYGRRAVALDVLAQNDPAIRLYQKWGYELLRDQLWMARPFTPETPVPTPSGSTRIRPYVKSDGPILAELDNALMPPEVRRLMPRHKGDFSLPALTSSILQSESEAWVAEMDGRPVGFLRATISRIMQAANLTSPIFGGNVPDSVAQDLLLTALQWTESRKTPRVLTEVAEHQWARRPLLDSLGFVEHFRCHTLVHRLGA